MIKLGVNIDHVATLRNARGTQYPSVVQAALRAEEAGADSITIHLREDRRHIRDDDVFALRPLLQTKMNLEMAVTEEMLADYARIQETLKSDAVKPVGGIGFVLPGMLRPRTPAKGGSGGEGEPPAAP